MRCAFTDTAPTIPRQRANIVPAGAIAPFDTVAFTHRAWAVSGRRWVSTNAGLKWSPNGWQLDTSWSGDVAQRAYYAEYAIRPALNFAATRGDIGLLDELASIYVAYFPRFKTLGELRGMKSAFVSTDMLDGAGADDERTLPWKESVTLGYRLRECPNCTAQFLHPAARLLGALARLQPAQRTASMIEFAREYVPLITRDHLLRLSYEALIDQWGLPGTPIGLVQVWNGLLDGSVPATTHYQRAMLDRDLWIVGAAAELLGASAADPQFVPIGDASASLRAIVATGVRLLETKRHFDPTTKNFSGAVVGSVSLFNGDFDDYVDYTYAGDTLPDFPTSRGPSPLPGVSWDISHAYRIPVVLRSLADNRTATGISYPGDDEIRLITNQYLYRVFNGDFALPRFRTFFSGSDGWFRVDYAGRAGYGIAPSKYCDSKNPKRPCLTQGALMGWALLSAYNPDIQRMLRAVVGLALSNDQQQVEHRTRYFSLGNDSFTVQDSTGRQTYPFMLFGVTAEMMRPTAGDMPKVR